jgi:GNAT superfamily N-acetyltransferase
VRVFCTADGPRVSAVFSRVGFGPDVLAEAQTARAIGGELFVAELHGELVGVSSCVAFGDSGWIGGVAVVPEARGRGIGSELTRSALRWLSGTRTVQLLSTPKALPLYQRLGFVDEGQYVVLRAPLSLEPIDHPTLRAATEAHTETIIALDRAATGEDRSRLVLARPWTAFVFERDGEPLGFHLRSTWEVGGTTIAADLHAGLALLRRAVQLNGTMRYVTIPSANLAALEALSALGFEEVNRASRMRLGPPLPWCPSQLIGAFNLYWG